MNVNELADALQETEPYYSTDYKLFEKAATMLRQQQAEIEALKADKALHDEAYLSQMKEIEALKKEAALQRLSEFTQETEHNPVGYFRLNEDCAWVESEAEYEGESTPLYTHPVKEMSETRIKQIFVEQTGFYFDDNPADDLALMDFAKALLLEAQEK